MILDYQHAHPDIVHHRELQRDHTPRPLPSATPSPLGVKHWCNRQPDTTCIMVRTTTSRLPMAAAAIVASTVIAACGSTSPSSAGSGGQQSLAQIRQSRCWRSPAACAATEQAAAFELTPRGGLGWRARTIEEQILAGAGTHTHMNRPGPPELWERFDAATAALAKALSGSSPATLAAAFTGLAEVCGLLAADVQRTHRPARAAG